MSGSEPSTAGNLGSGEAARAMAAAISGMKDDLSAMLVSAKLIADQFSKISKSAATAGGSASRGAGKTGSSNPTAMDNSLGEISDAGGGGGGGGGGGRAANAARFAGKLGLAATDDLTVNTGAAYTHEWAGWITGGTDHSKLSAMVAGTNNYNVSSASDYAQAASMMAQAGLTNANQLNSATTMARVAGQDNISAATSALAQVAPSQYYSALAAGVQTRGADGQDLSAQQISSQWFKRIFGGRKPTQEQVQAAFRQGGSAEATLRDAGYTPEMIEQQRIAFRTQAGLAPGQDIGSMSAEDYGKATGIDEGAPGAVSQSNRAQADLRKTDKYYDNTITGAKAVNDLIAKANDGIADANGWLEDIFNVLNTTRGGYETANSTATGRAVTGGGKDFLSNMLGGAGGGAGANLGTKALGKAAPGIAGFAARAGLPFLGAAGVIGAVGGGAILGAVELGKWRDQKKQERLAKLSPEARQAELDREAQSHQGLEPSEVLKDPAAQDMLTKQFGYAKGAWEVEDDQIAKIHKGEMVLPETFADSLRKEIGTAAISGSTGSSGSRNPTQVNIQLTIGKATDAEAVKFARTVQGIIQGDQELTVIGAGRAANSAYA